MDKQNNIPTLLPCPFCGADKWNRVACNIFRRKKDKWDDIKYELTHKPFCFLTRYYGIKNGEIKNHKTSIYDFTLWNKRTIRSEVKNDQT